MTTSDKKATKAARKAEEIEARKKQAKAKLLAEKEAKFWALPFGQARTAKLAGDKYFQVEMPIDSTAQTAYGKAVADPKRIATKKHRGQGQMLGYIEKEGWELVHAGFVFKESGQISRDKFLSSGQQVTTTGATWGIYLFRANDQPAETDEPWLEWAAQAQQTS